MPTRALTAKVLFERLFLPLYPDHARRDLSTARMTDANPGGNVAMLRSLDDAAFRFARSAPDAFGDPSLLFDFSDVSVRRLGAALTRARRDRWLREVGPDGAPLLVHVAVHGAMYVGACAVRGHGNTWQLRSPLWESLVRSKSAVGDVDLPIFGWWLKALSDDEIDRATLAARYRMHVEVPSMDPSAFARVVPALRSVPRLVKARYDTLYRHLRAHVPELTDLGRDFPSAERMAEMGFRWLDFRFLGNASFLLVHGPGAHGVHLFWLDAGGFTKAAFFPSEMPESYELETEGDLLRVRLQTPNGPGEHVMLYWGP